MRRLANQSRDDSYASNRDYQALHKRHSRRVGPIGRSGGRLVFKAAVAADKLGLVCWGGYLRASKSMTLQAELNFSSKETTQAVNLDTVWRRVGAVISDVAGSSTLALYDTVRH